jgi:Ni/Co efflux regulator RcnB
LELILPFDRNKITLEFLVPGHLLKIKNGCMKKLLFILAFTAGIATMSYAQQSPKKVESGDSKTKVKPKTTVKDKAHNVVHPKHKRSHGVKAKDKNGSAKAKVVIHGNNS